MATYAGTHTHIIYTVTPGAGLRDGILNIELASHPCPAPDYKSHPTFAHVSRPYTNTAKDYLAPTHRLFGLRVDSFVLLRRTKFVRLRIHITRGSPPFKAPSY